MRDLAWLFPTWFLGLGLGLFIYLCFCVSAGVLQHAVDLLLADTNQVPQHQGAAEWRQQLFYHRECFRAQINRTF